MKEILIAFNVKFSSIEFESEDVYFKHLAFANQTYWQHFMDSIKYSFISLKASFYFFCHAVWPDIFIKNFYGDPQNESYF